jgi:hypothetical protein
MKKDLLAVTIFWLVLIFASIIAFYPKSLEASLSPETVELTGPTTEFKPLKSCTAETNNGCGCEGEIECRTYGDGSVAHCIDSETEWTQCEDGGGKSCSCETYEI